MKTETRDTNTLLLNAIKDLGYSPEDMEDPRSNRHKIFVPGERLSHGGIERSMYRLTKPISGLEYYDSVIVSTENGDARDGAVVTFEEVTIKTFGALKVGDTLFKNTGSGVFHAKVLKVEEYDGLVEILFRDQTHATVREIFLPETQSMFPFYSCIEKLESDLEVCLKRVKMSKKEVVSC